MHKIIATTSDYEKFIMIIDISRFLFLVTDKDGRIEYVNSKFTEITGYTLDEVKGSRVFLLLLF